MTHDQQNHDHHHDHDHSHDHSHSHHSHGKSPEMSMEEKLAKLLENWIQHSEEHAKSYELWAERAKLHGITGVDLLLEKAAEKTRAIDEDFKAALAVLKKSVF